jgi:hypothetical protein
MDVGMLTRLIVTSGTGGFEDDRQRCHHMPPMPSPEQTESAPMGPADADSDALHPSPIEPEETVDGIPVLAEVRAIEPVATSSLPAVQAAAAAATGFVAGAATLALVRRHSARKLARTRARRRVDALPIIGSRSFLVDVHLIAKPGE